MDDVIENNTGYQIVKKILDELVQNVCTLAEVDESQYHHSKDHIQKKSAEEQSKDLSEKHQIEDESSNKITDEEHEDEEEWEDANAGDEGDREQDKDFEDEHELDEEEQLDEEYDEQEEEEEDYKKELDDDEIAENPAYIPKQGKFYMHDVDRSVPPAHRSTFDSHLSEDKDEGKEEISAVSKHEDDEPKSRAERVHRWKHDMFDERIQGPKGRGELMRRYGHDIRRDNEDEDEGNIKQNFRKTDQGQQRARGARERGGVVRQSRGRGVVTNRRSSISFTKEKYEKKTENEQEQGESQQFSGSGGRIIRNSAVAPGERGRAYGLGKNGGTIGSSGNRVVSDNQNIQREGRFVREEFQQQQQYIHNQHHNSQQQYNQSSSFTPQNFRGPLRGGRGRGKGFQQAVQREGRFAGGESHREERFVGGESQRGRFVRRGPQRGRYPRGDSQQGNFTGRDSYREERFVGSESKSQQQYDQHHNSQQYNQLPPLTHQNITEHIRGGRGGSGGFGGGSQRSVFNQESNVQSHMVPPQQQYNQPSLINYQAPVRGGRGGGGGFGGGSQRGNFQGSVPSRSLLPQGMPQYGARNDSYNNSVGNVPPPLQQPIVQHYQSQQHQIYQSPQQISLPPPPLVGQQQNYPHPRQPTEPVFFAPNQQQNRMMNQFPQRERQRLHIEPPPH